MTREEGRRVIAAGWAIRVAVLLILLHLPVPAHSLVLGGRLGLEVDGLGQDYQSLDLYDDRIDIGEGIEERVEETPVRSREATTLALLEIRLDAGSRTRSWLHLMESGRVGITRQRSSLTAEAGFRTRVNRFRLENQWDIQGGDDEPAAGSQDQLTATWDRDSLPVGLRSQVRLGVTWSHSSEDTLDAIFEYRSVRGQAQLRRDLTPRFEIRGLAGFRKKEAFRSTTGSYDAWFTEAEGNGSIGFRDQLEALVRFEDRTYEADSAGGGIPSSRTLTVEGRYEVRPNEGWRPFTDHRFEWQDYASSSEVFQDHRTWRGQLGTDLYWNGLFGGGEDVETFLRPEVRFRLAGQVELYSAPDDLEDAAVFTQTYDSYGGIFGIAREGGPSFWVDLTLEAGRRDYRADGGSTSLTIEGLSFSLSTSDYTYYRATFLAEWNPVPWLRAEGFLQVDEEQHDVSADDFRLWIVNVSLTYPF